MHVMFCSFCSERWQNERLTNKLWAGHAEYHVQQDTEQILKPNERQIFYLKEILPSQNKPAIQYKVCNAYSLNRFQNKFTLHDKRQTHV